ncbi:MAG: aminotransferase class V-fold PLP-dependent enzyme, partial [bacterium]
LDNNATTAVTKNVRKKINNVLKKCYGNPSSLYKIAIDAANELDESRRIIAKTINAEVDEIIFTGCATESNNTILKGLAEIFYPGKKKILSTPIEHPSVISTLEYLKTKGILVEFIPVDSKGVIEFETLEKLIDQDTFLICCMLANNEIGTILDIKKIALLAKKYHALLFSDCVQALAKIPVDVKDLGVNYASFSGHKIHSPKGVGALYVKRGSPYQILVHGGHQESGLRAGTEGLHNIAGFAEACKATAEVLKRSTQILSNKMLLINELKNMKADIKINSPETACLPNTVNITLPGVSNSVLMATLDFYGIAVSAGSACSTPENKPSHVLKAIGLSDEEARETIRISLSEFTSRKDIKYTIKVMRNFLSGAVLPVNALTPKQLDENLIFGENNYILDVRWRHERKMFKGLPNSHEAPFITFRKYYKQIPKDGNIIVVCQAGYNAPIIAFYLRSKGYRKVSFLMSGLYGWRIANAELYKKIAGQNISQLEPV